MSRIIIEGNHPLHGSIRVQGAKNAVLPILAATVLCRGVSVIENCPDLMDVRTTIDILKYLGARVTFENNTVTVDTSGDIKYDIPVELMEKLRSSIVFMGPLIARCKKAYFSAPGGCALGQRPIDLHIKAFKRLGAGISEEHGYYNCSGDELSGNLIYFPIPSVGATENVMMCACAINGRTVIENAAKEPEISDLAEFLIKMGAKIDGAGSSTITIDGTEKLNGAVHRVMPDRIAAMTYLCCCASAGGAVTVEDIIPEHIAAGVDCLREAGMDIELTDNSVTIFANHPMNAVKSIKTMPYPGFPTDIQTPMLAVLTRAKGASLISETIFANRFAQVTELVKMGADIDIISNVAAVRGVKSLSGANVTAVDLRGGAALVVAALGADGITEIENVCLIDRGYEQLAENLHMLGAVIKREN